MSSGREIDLVAGPLEDAGTGAVAVTVQKGGELEGPARTVDGWLGGALVRAFERGSIRGREGDVLFLPTGADSARPDVLAVGVGEEEPGPEAIRRAAGVAVRETRRRRLESVTLGLPPRTDGRVSAVVQAAAEGLALGDWSLDELRAEDDERPERPSRAAIHAGDRVDEPAPLRESAGRGSIAADAQNLTRDLVALPANVITPAALGRRAERLAEEYGLEVEVWGPDRLRQEGFGGLLAVARGSTEEPRFIRLEHRGADDPPVVLVGKGVTFDSGGISLKPSEGMEEMKYDMAGAAAVLGALAAAARSDLARRVVGLVPSTENLPSGTALKPGDVIRGLSGTSIEVVNTDAEGRLILSDALSYASRLDPRAVVDLATLTGGCVVALGHEAAGLMSDHDDLVDALEEAGRRTGERVWRLPLWKEYRRHLDSELADIKNSGGREASTVTAGYFLKEFAGDVRWAHLDIAGVAWADEERGYQPKGATGYGVRLVLEWLRTAD